MKNLFTILLLSCSLMATAQCCSNGNQASSVNSTTQSATCQANGVELIYFHGKQRCATCMAIERETRNLVENELKEMASSGKVRMRVVDFSTVEGKAIATKYRVSFSSLFVVSNPGDNETTEDLTRFAFANARTNPENFRKEIKSKVMNAIN